MALTVSRRTVVTAGAACAFVASPAAAALPMLRTPPINPVLLRRALAAMDAHRSAIAAADRIAVIDFALISGAPRLHLVDLGSARIRSVLVAHGRGSDPAYTGWVSRFSNEPRSNATSVGAYVTGEAYVGEHGRSLRLLGLDPTNSNAEARAIVIHTAAYVNEALAAATGKVGRSEGCFAVSAATLEDVLAHLGTGRFIYADKLQSA